MHQEREAIPYRVDEVATLGPGKKHCYACANILDARAELCPKCGVRQPGSAGALAVTSPAPAPISALMSGVLLNVGLYALLRFKAVTDITLGPGFSSRSLLGVGLLSLGVAAAFLLAQHSPDLELQQRVLAALAPLIKKDTEAAQQHAYLYDRVHAVRLRSYQRFGTQGQCVARGQWSPLPIENPEQVDERRRQIGLPPLSEYIVMMNGVCAKHDLGGAPLPGQPQIPDALRLVE